MHACKYPDRPILGYLIWQGGEEGCIGDVLPICHSNPTSLILDMTSDVVTGTEYKASPSKLVGLYYATEDGADRGTPVYIENIAESIKKLTGNCQVVQIMNTLLSTKDKLFIKINLAGSQNIMECHISNSTMAATQEMMDKLLSDKQEHLFTDFEDHMNSGVNADFRNAYIDELVQTSTN
jgi:hypothetical protein